MFVCVYNCIVLPATASGNHTLVKQTLSLPFITLVSKLYMWLISNFIMGNIMFACAYDIALSAASRQYDEIFQFTLGLFCICSYASNCAHITSGPIRQRHTNHAV